MVKLEREREAPTCGGLSLCAECRRSGLALNYKHPESGEPICQACYRRLRRHERGLQKPGPKPKPVEELAPKTLRNYGLSPNPRPKRTEESCAQGHPWSEDEKAKPLKQRKCGYCARTWQQKYHGREITPANIPLAQRNGEKTHCPAGHAYAEHGLYRPQDRSRQCRVCIRHRRIRDTYGLEPEDFDAMWAEQGGACAVCRRPFGNLESWNDLRNAHVDHDHSSSAVRGLLCVSCNNGLGRFEDDSARLRSAADYIDRYR